jgi:hypothetical protein
MNSKNVSLPINSIENHKQAARTPSACKVNINTGKSAAK